MYIFLPSTGTWNLFLHFSCMCTVRRVLLLSNCSIEFVWGWTHLSYVHVCDCSTRVGCSSGTLLLEHILCTYNYILSCGVLCLYGNLMEELWRIWYLSPACKINLSKTTQFANEYEPHHYFTCTAQICTWFSLNNFEWVYYTQTWYWSEICYLYPRSQKCST